MTPECEAFAVLAFENYRNKWIKYQAYRREYPGLKLMPCKYMKGTSTPGEPGTCEVDGKKLRVYGDGVGKYTKADVGQAKYGGWIRDGLDRYGELKDLSIAARKKKKSHELERLSLDEVREDLGITAATFHEHKAKPKAASVPDNAGVDCGGLTSSEEEEEEDGDDEE